MITISNISYTIIEQKTPADHEQAGHKNTAEAMRRAKIARELVLQRPNGKKYFGAMEYEDGRFGAVFTYGY